MDTISYKTKSASPKIVEKKWLLIDAENQTLGRLCSNIAYLLKGKHKTYYTPHIDCGDNIVVINAEKIIFSGNKMTEKEYVSYTNYPGGQRFSTPSRMLNEKPEMVIEKGVKGMLPKNSLGREIFRSLFVYEGTTHPHEAQKPVLTNIDTIK